MPKSLLIDPAEARARGVLTAPAIPLNAYVPDSAAEAALYGSANLVRMYHDMALIREFETMLDKIKKEGTYEGIAYAHKGPAHLSIGQEAAAVGQAYHLTADDFIFGSHRSHGEIIAKCLSAVAKMPEDEVQRVMEGYLGGATLRAVEKVSDSFKESDTYSAAIDFILYGTLAEIFGRATGFNKGLGGSMHAFFPPFGVMPNNAIVGGSADIATGAALFKRVNRKPGIVIANIGDASVGCGPVWEAMNFVAMDQFHTLWAKEIGGHPPILFSFMNNFYGMGGQPKGETMGFEVLARAGLGVNPQAMHAERVDGYNPLAVADAITRKRQVLEAGEGPVLLDVVTYRFSGHSPSDASSYRDASEMKLWQAQDALLGYRDYLIANGHADVTALDTIHAEAKVRIRRTLEAAAALDLSPRLSVSAHNDAIGVLMFSNNPEPVGRALRSAPLHSAPTGTLQRAFPTESVLLPRERSRLAQLAEKHRYAFDAEGKPHAKLKTLTYAEALTEALLHRFYEDPTLIAYGEENRDWGGAFGVYRGLTEALPYHRLFNSPISEAAIVGTGVGYALCGGRAVVELMYADFMGRAGDEIFNQMAKWQAMSGGTLTLPLVLRVSVGSKYGAQHSQDWSALVAHIPGLRVFFPATPYDAKGMLNLALGGSDPVVFFESQRLYPEAEKLVAGGVPVEYYETPLGEPAVRREGRDVTIVTIGATLYVALEAAAELENYGVSVEVIDLRFLNPLNYAPLVTSARKTGKVIVASDACERGSFAHTVASNLTQLAFDALDGPVTVVGARNWIVPPAEMEDVFFPQKEWIMDALHERILPLPSYTPKTDCSDAEMVRRNRLGV
jgi:2-oxoisovalerate dehydrogenase E1 component